MPKEPLVKHRQSVILEWSKLDAQLTDLESLSFFRYSLRLDLLLGVLLMYLTIKEFNILLGCV